MTRQQWFDHFFMPHFRVARPKDHFTFEMFGNKSRHEKSFDKRRIKDNFARKARAIWDAEQLSRDALQRCDTKESHHYAKICVERVIEYIDEPTSNGLNRRRAVRKLEFDKIIEAIPDFTSLHFKIYGGKIAKDDSPHIVEFKKSLSQAYQELHYDNNAQPIQEWYNGLMIYQQQLKRNRNEQAIS